ncbi:hypothetical protein F5X71_27165 [Nocardia brasiliensis]|uniref:Uncharacterized protein n=1 Tax=Nocardia brasiliensis TaxID=37326 RepID=A0A6G9XX48_NOCBR|nr:hypothetical protein [Nocardia brasiliensis]QIS05502.1 hypothetical protein F5X71_27165 [Nocardia brasiliensis]
MPLLTIRLPANATLAVALRELKLTVDDVDTAYGLIPVDPAQGLYALRVTDSAAARLDPDRVQIFADSRIEAIDEPKPPV